MRPPLALAAALLLVAAGPVAAAAGDLPTGAFAFEVTAEVPGTPTAVWNGLTGDIAAWWDHSMSGDPLRLFIEPEPGGGFWEIFDGSGDGVRHAVVTYAKRGQRLRMEGPLGLAGHAIHMVTTYDLTPLDGGRTRLVVTVHAAGEVQPGWPEIVETTWRHFVHERFVPFMEAGGHDD